MDANDGQTSGTLRRALAGKTYARSAAYDAAIANYFSGVVDGTPAYRAQGGSLKQELRYGENPHQTAAFYADGSDRPGVSTAAQIQGKALSYNNINDTDAAYELVAEFGNTAKGDKPAVAIIKHANPCGVATANDFITAYKNALACDPVSAFGGIVALNGNLDAATAKEIVKVFTEVVIAPSADDDAMSRIDSARIAARKAEDAQSAAGWDTPKTKGCACASDAFFPFADGMLAAASAGATCVIQPGGSIRDAEVIAAADEQGLAMVFTGMRHFRH